jgi:hypothetical protein
VARHHYYGFGDVDRAAASQPNDAVAAGGAVLFNRLEYVVFDRVSVHAVEDLMAYSCVFENGDHSIKCRRRAEAWVGHDERPAYARLFEARGQAPYGGAAKDDPGGK